MSLTLISCNLTNIAHDTHNDLIFSNIESDYIVTDTNQYGCKKIDRSMVEHILKTGIKVTQRDIHDFYDTTGCSIKGSIVINDISSEFTFEYGGIIQLSNDTLLGCAEECCKNNFNYCTWDKNGLSGE